MSELFGIKHLIISEKHTANISEQTLKGIFLNYPKIIDVFLKLPYFVGELDSSDTEKGAVQATCQVQYSQSPYTFWSIYSLYEKGYYLEGIILYRHLLEAFIQMRYFNKFPNKLKDHVLQVKRVTFSAMFNEFSPGFYKRYYSNQFSEAVHGLWFKDIYRNDRENNRIIMGNEFNEEAASYIMNLSFPLLYGFLNWFERFFPNNTLGDNEEVYKTFEESKEWISNAMQLHKKANLKSSEYYVHLENFIL